MILGSFLTSFFSKNHVQTKQNLAWYILCFSLLFVMLRSLFSFVQMFRCALRRNPSSSLANDCITAMAEGLHSSFYNYFVVSLWGDGDPSYLSGTESHFDLEWKSLKNVLTGICQKCGSDFQNAPHESYDSSWNFLINSKFHRSYHQRSSFTGLSSSTIQNTRVFEPSAVCIKAGEDQDTSFYTQLLKGALDALHALYECLKLDNLRKQ